MNWKRVRIAGVDYSLSHLNTRLFQTTPSAPLAVPRTVKISFGCHTFTRELSPADTPDLHFRNGGETRAFCTIRHGLSLSLPAIVQAAATGARAYFSQNRNFLLLDGNAGPYVACFNMRRSNKPDCDVVMFVVSAYPKPNLPPKLHAITFPTLVATIAAGNAVTKPAKKVAY